MNYKKGIFAALAIALIALLVFLGYRYLPIKKDYVVSINNEKVSVSEFKLMLEAIKDQMKSKGLNNFDTMVDGKKASDLAKEQALKSIIEYKVEVQQAKARGLTLSDAEIQESNRYVDSIISQNPDFTQTLSTAGLSVDDFKRINLEFGLSSKVKQQILKDYYEKNKEKYVVEQVRAKHILIKTIDESNKELPKEQQEEKRKQAESILAKAKSGQDFAALAKQYSEDPGSKDNGGEYTFPRGQMVKEFEDTAFSLEPGEISGLVKTQYGYHIIKLEEKIPKAQLSFEDAMEKVQVDAQYDKILEEWKKGSKIDRNDAVYNSIK